jgi:hypothetical protein
MLLKLRFILDDFTFNLDRNTIVLLVLGHVLIATLAISDFIFSRSSWDLGSALEL